MENDVLQRQLLLRAYNSAYLSTEVISKGIASLFSKPMYQAVALQLVRYYEVHQEPITKVALKSKLEEQFDRDRKLNRANLSSEDEVAYYHFIDDLDNSDIDDTDEVTDQLTQYVKSTLTKQVVIEEAGKATKDTEYDLTTHLKDRIDHIETLDIVGRGNDTISVYDDFEEKAKIYKEFSTVKLPSGLQGFDDATDGGLARGELGMIAAATGYGKTTTLSNLAVNYTRQGYNVFFVSLEELKSRSLLRFEKIFLRQPTKFFLTSEGYLKADYVPTLQKTYSTIKQSIHLGNLELLSKSPHVFTLAQLQSLLLAKERQQQLKYDVVIIDYPDLLLNPHATDNESQDGGRLFEDLRRFAQANEVLLWTASQLNRTTYSQQNLKTAEAIEGSKRKLNTCEFVCTLNRTHEEYENGFIRFYIDKNRNRDSFMGDTLYFKYNPATIELTDETSLEYQQHQDLLNSGETTEKNRRKQQYQAKKEQTFRQNQELANTLNSQFKSFGD